MLADPKARALADNFAGQWLYLRRQEYQKPDRRVYPDFDQRLRASMKTETEMFFNSIVQENRSALDFLDATIPSSTSGWRSITASPASRAPASAGSSFDPAQHRGGLLGQASVLTVTSYNNRTSVALRGKWILENILAAAPPPPPPNVPTHQ